MREKITLILILLLLLLSPVSYSSEKIPDFTPESSVTLSYAVKVQVAAIDGASKVCSPPPCNDSRSYPKPILAVFKTACPETSRSGRAPPA